MDNSTKIMDRETDTAKSDPSATEQLDASVDKMNPEFPARVIAGIRMRVRRLFKKEDPNIYPFF